MDATESATATARRTLGVPVLADPTVYATGDCAGDGGGAGDAGCCGSNVNDTPNEANGVQLAVLLLLPRSNATPSTPEDAPAAAAAADREGGRGEDSHFDSSFSGAQQLQLQPQRHPPQFSDSSDDGAAYRDVKDQMELAEPCEIGEGTRPNEARERTEEAEAVATERLVFITALASDGATEAAAEAIEAAEAAAEVTATTTTTTTAAAKKWPLETVEVAANHNTLATVVGDHGAATINGEAAVSKEQPQQAVYVRPGEASPASPLVRCTSQPDSNVVRIQILPAGVTELLPAGASTDDPSGIGRGIGGRHHLPIVGPQGSSVSVSSASAAGSKCLSSKVTVVSFGVDGGVGSVVVGDCSHEHPLTERRPNPATAAASEVAPAPEQLCDCDSDGKRNSGDGVERRDSAVTLLVTVRLEELQNEHTATVCQPASGVVVPPCGLTDTPSVETEPQAPASCCVAVGADFAAPSTTESAQEAPVSQAASATGEVEADDRERTEDSGYRQQPADLTDMVQKKSVTLSTGGGGVGGPTTAAELDSSAYVYYMATAMAAAAGTRPPSTGGGSGSSGQCSPSDMLDSGTCSDIEVTPPPLPKKMSQMFKSSSSSSTAALTRAIKHGSANSAGAVPARCDKEHDAAVINQQSAETPQHHHHHLELHRLQHNQTHQHQQQQQQQQHLLNDDDDDDNHGHKKHDHEEEQDGQNGKHQTHVDLTQNGFAVRQQQKQQLGSVIVTDSDGSESCLSCDSLNFEHLSSLQQLGQEIGVGQTAAAPNGTERLDSSAGSVADRELVRLGQSAAQADKLVEGSEGTPIRRPPFLGIGGARQAGNVCGLPDSLLAAIRESRPKVYCTNDDDHNTQQQQYFEPVTVNRNGAGGSASVVEQLELLMPTTTTRSILMDKINSLEQSVQGRAVRAFGDQPEHDAPSNYLHQNHHAINGELAASPLPARAQSSCSAGSVTTESARSNHFESDRFYKFHIHERRGVDGHDPESSPETTPSVVDDDESFAGLKDLSNGTSTIRSNKGTVRGVKNRVRNGIATFLQMQQTGMKNYKDKEAGKVVVYSTSMGIVRETYTKCMNVKQILRTLLIKFEEKDIFMSNEYQQEIKERMQTDTISIPQVFVDGQHVGDAECIERLNESGELRKMLKPYKCLESPYMCKICGGYRLLPCPSCGGSKKSIHRNHFTAEFVALKCMNCDEVGLVKCHSC